MLDEIKTLLGITDDSRDDLLNTIISLTEARLRLLLALPDQDDGSKAEIPEQLQYIVSEVSIRRYNRIGSEGLASHSVEGETMSWPDNDFAPYDKDMQAYLDEQESASTDRGRVRFY